MLPPSEDGTRAAAAGGGRGRITVASPSGSKAAAGGAISVRCGAISVRAAAADEPGFPACEGSMRVASSSSSMLIDSLRFLAFRRDRRNAEQVEDVGLAGAAVERVRRRLRERVAEGDRF